MSDEEYLIPLSWIFIIIYFPISKKYENVTMSEVLLLVYITIFKCYMFPCVL